MSNRLARDQFGNMILKDSYNNKFTTPEELMDFTSMLSEYDSWEQFNLTDIEAVPISYLPLLGTPTAYSKVLGREEEILGSEEAIADTAANSKLGIVRFDSGKCECIPLGMTGVVTLASRAGVLAPGPSKVYQNSPAEYAGIINTCSQYQEKRVTALVRGEKVRAINSASGGNGYCILDEHELVTVIFNTLARDFPRNKFEYGEWTHELLHCEWSLPEQAESITQTYEAALLNAGHFAIAGNLLPVVVFYTSDVADSAASICGRIRMGNNKHSQSVAIGAAMRIIHKNDTKITDFEDATRALFARYIDRIGDLEGLLSIRIKNPENCLRNIMSRYMLKRSQMEEAVEALWDFCSPDFCTAHDVYIAMNAPLCQLEQDSAIQANEYAERVARALHMREETWREYDVPYIINAKAKVTI